MSSTVAELDVMAPDRAAQLLGDCCGSTRWVSAMVARRPFGSVDRLLAAADDTWRSLGPDDWREAFSHHPRIGERRSAAQQSERSAAWAEGEQASVGGAADATLTALERSNREYEQRFGYIYIVCASGRGADELLADVTARLRNDPEDELAVAADEQRKITRLRLKKLLGQGDTA
ncbi:MAG: 2-oxo-4-hydroxy-4-carboxy-5-ureidoimidazoline decarboxylase [Gemmatimonadaceae bacterium]